MCLGDLTVSADAGVKQFQWDPGFTGRITHPVGPLDAGLYIGTGSRVLDTARVGLRVVTRLTECIAVG